MSPELREQLREAVASAYQHDTRDPWELMGQPYREWTSTEAIARRMRAGGYRCEWYEVIGVWHGWEGGFDPRQESHGMNLDGLDFVDYLDAYQFGHALRAEHTARYAGITPLRSPSTGLPYDSLALMAEMEKR